MDETLPLGDAVERLLDGTAHGLVDPGGEIGCMLNTGMIATHPDHVDLACELARRRANFRQLLAGKLRVWVDETRAERLACYLAAVMQGMAIQARDGFSLADLQAVAIEGANGVRAIALLQAEPTTDAENRPTPTRDG